MFGEQEYVSIYDEGRISTKIRNIEAVPKEKRYVKYTKVILKVKNNGIVSKIGCNLPVEEDELINEQHADALVRQVLLLYSSILTKDIQITEISIKMSNYRIATFNVVNNVTPYLKSIYYKTKINSLHTVG